MLLPANQQTGDNSELLALQQVLTPEAAHQLTPEAIAEAKEILAGDSFSPELLQEIAAHLLDFFKAFCINNDLAAIQFLQTQDAFLQDGAAEATFFDTCKISFFQQDQPTPTEIAATDAEILELFARKRKLSIIVDYENLAQHAPQIVEAIKQVLAMSATRYGWECVQYDAELQTFFTSREEEISLNEVFDLNQAFQFVKAMLGQQQ